VEVDASKAIEQRSTGNEIQFRLYLNDLANLYEQSNSDSNGALADLISEITDLSPEEAASQLSNSGLIDMEQMTNLIDNAEAIEEVLLNEIGEENLRLIVEDETGGIDPPQEICFWCNDHDCTEWAGASMDGSTCTEIRVCRRVRFWIGGGWHEQTQGCN
jgi:hypothetical protein